MWDVGTGRPHVASKLLLETCTRKILSGKGDIRIKIGGLMTNDISIHCMYPYSHWGLHPMDKWQELDFILMRKLNKHITVTTLQILFGIIITKSIGIITTKRIAMLRRKKAK